MEPVFGVRRDPPPDLDAVGEDEALAARIRAEIERDGPMPFARFMDLALYDPDGGYYRATDARPGRAGDFLTAPEMHPVFGWALAGLLEDVWRRLGEPRPFVLREHGAGTGTLALAILDRLDRTGSPLRDALAYDPVEVEPEPARDHRVVRLAERGADAPLLGPDGRRGPVTGVVLANEVLDALPVHRVAPARRPPHRDRGRPRGRRVRRRRDGTRRRRRSRARLADEEIDLVDGQTAEICLGVERWVAETAAGLERGLLLLIDYGAPAAELYDPVRRRDGTLMAYVRHRASHDPYAHVGRQDLTAHVDVTAVERAAAAAGLTHLATTTQAELLIGLGTEALLREVQEDPATSLEAYLELRSSLMRLLDPAGDGPVPRDGLRARLAGRSAARRVRVPGSRPAASRTDAGRLGRSTYCRSTPAARTLRDGRARPDGERRANLHARSAHAAPRRPRPPVAPAPGLRPPAISPDRAPSPKPGRGTPTGRAGPAPAARIASGADASRAGMPARSSRGFLPASDASPGTSLEGISG